MGLFWQCLSVFAVIAISVEFARSDLPIHTVTRDIGGAAWTFKIGAPSDNPVACSSGVPNSNVENLLKDPVDWFREHEVLTKEFTLVLSDVPKKVEGTVLHAKEFLDARRRLSDFPDTRSSWSVLPAYTTDNKLVGHWTMVYDEGFEVFFRPVDEETTYQLMSFVKYSRVDNAKCPAGKKPVDGDSESDDGTTPCYETDSSRTMVGWYTGVTNKDGKKKWGCFIGQKVDATPNTNSTSAASATLDSAGRSPEMREVKATVQEVSRNDALAKFGVHSYRKTSRMINFNNDESGSAFAASFLQTKTQLSTGLYPCPKMVNASFISPHSLPQQFSWGDPFTDPSFDASHDDTIINQGNCGSCYSVASAYALQKRTIILLERLLGKRGKQWNELFSDGARISVQAPLSCSHYNQGCEGGYPYLVGKWSSEFGIPPVSCMDYSASNRKCVMADVLAMVDARDDHDNSTASPEAKEIHSHKPETGEWSHITPRLSSKPVGGLLSTGAQKILSPTAFEFLQRKISTADAGDTCGADERVYSSSYGYVGGCYECCSEEAMMYEIYNHGPLAVAFDAPLSLMQYKTGIYDKSPESHSRICDDPEKGLNGWEFSTHAVVVVGWGVDPPATPGGEEQRFWMIRNSWGDWGEKGHMKLIRGKNRGGIEAQAVYLDADPTRGKLRKVLEMHGVEIHRAVTAYFVGSAALASAAA